MIRVLYKRRTVQYLVTRFLKEKMQDNEEELTVEVSRMANITSFERCVLELIANSLNAQAMAIAVRIHAKKREIQVVDNGIGIPREMLIHIAEYNLEAINNQEQVYKSAESNYLVNVRRQSDRFTIASRHQSCKATFMKEFEGLSSNLKQIEQRPSRGTTVSIYGFHEIPSSRQWNMSAISFLIAAIAVTKLEVSFSIRDEDRRRVVLRIAKPHSPIRILRRLFGEDILLNRIWSIQRNLESTQSYSVNHHGYVGLSDKNNAIQWIFLNHRPIYCPLVLKLIKIAFKERLNMFPKQHTQFDDKNIFILFFLTFSRQEFTFVTENEKRYIIFHDMQKILNAIKNCLFKCLTEEVTSPVATACLRKTQLLKSVYLTSKKSVFNNNVEGEYNSSMIKRKVVIVGLKKRKIMSIVNDSHKIDESIKNNVPNSQIASVKYTYLREDRTVKRMRNDVDKMQENLMNLDVTDNPVKSDKVSNYQRDYNNDNNCINVISPLSEWSNWSYHTNNKKHTSAENINTAFKSNNQFDFLPRKLYGHLRCHVKLTNVKYNSPTKTIPFTENWQHKEIKVHPCKLKQKLCEFKLTRASLKCIKIINQVNNEFIAAWMAYNERKILLMIDQHAVHERIRYEDLLLRYNVQNEDELLSVNLRNPLMMEFPAEKYNLLLRNRILLKKYGINLGSSKEDIILIRTIPQCLIANNASCNDEKTLSRIHGLLNEILNNHSVTGQTNSLPLSIHNAVASEACHGAIKFGDKLTLEQCTSLVKLLEHTKFPNRCAHGRPTTIPVIDFSELGKRNGRLPEKKLNFTSLKQTDSLK